MKKLMFAVVAAVAMTTFAKDDTSLSSNAVYNLTFTTKYLDYNTKSYNWKDFAPKGAKKAVAEFPELVVKEVKSDTDVTGYRLVKWNSADEGYNKALKGKVKSVVLPGVGYSCEELFAVVAQNLQAKFGDVELAIVDYKETKKKIDTYKYDAAKKKAVKGDSVTIVTKITFNYQNLSKAKVATKNLKGVVIVDDGEATSYLWDPKETDSYENVFAGSKTDKSGALKKVKLANASKELCKNFEFKPGMWSDDKDAEGGFAWHTSEFSDTLGWGTGKVALDDLKKAYIYSSLAGGYAGKMDVGSVFAHGEYGTWKLSYDKASTQLLRLKTEEAAKASKISRKYDGVDYNKAGKVSTYEEILGRKKVELVD